MKYQLAILANIFFQVSWKIAIYLATDNDYKKDIASNSRRIVTKTNDLRIKR